MSLFRGSNTMDSRETRLKVVGAEHERCDRIPTGLWSGKSTTTNDTRASV